MKKAAGFTLVELLISLTLGLVISMMVMQLLISSNRTATLSDGVLQAQETGRFAVSLLSTSLQKAGFSFGESAAQAYMAGADCAGTPLPDYCIRDSAANDAGDRIAIIRSATAADSQSCSGQGAIAANTQVIDVYWVQNNSLRCLTYDFNSKNPIGAAQSMVTNVQALHVLYGVEATPSASGKPNVTYYARAGQVNNWEQVKAVKFSILTRSADTNTLDVKNRTYVLLDAVPYRHNDGIARQIFTTSVLRMN